MGATGLKCNFFFFKFATKSLEKKKGPVAPPNGRQAPVAHPRGDQPVALGYRRQGAGRPSCGRQGQAAYIRPPPHSLLSFDLKKSKKIQKKDRGEKKGSGEALPNCVLLIYR